MPRSSSSTSMPTMGVKWPEAGPAASPDRVIEQHIRRTRRQVKWVEIFQGLLVLAVVGLAVLFVVAIADHWLVRGGLPNWVRWAIWLGLSGWGLGYFWAKVLPLIVYRIHPLYAAQTIETARPSLRNNLINFLLLRNDPRWAPEPVVQAVEESAARELLHLPPEGVVDRQPVIRWGYALVAVVALFALYVILSPKSPWVSVSRVLWPWADIPAPTRVRIEAVQPGDTTAQRGESVRVSAEVYGLAEGEEVLFYYSTADGQIQNQAIPMKPDQPGQPRYSLPLDSFVARQDTQYYIQAGDARTRIYQILVDIPLVVTADRLVYEYPSYTGLGRAEVRGQGDIRAVEGTKVTIHASANQPLSQAEIDLDGQGRWRRPMRVEGQSAIGELQLRLHPEDPLRPEYTSYLLRAQTLDGRTNRQPNRYMIEVLPDRPPRVSLRLGVLEELPEEIELPRSRAVEMHVEAEDADFGLRRVAIQLQKQGQILEVPPLLDWAGTNQSGTGKSSNSISSGGNSSGNTGSNASLGLSTGQAASAPTSAKAKPDGHQGLFQGSWQFIPAKLGLKPGDVIFYWARAEDTKLPKPNVAETPRRRIVIVEDPPGQPPPDQPPPEAGSGQQAPAPGQQPSMPPKEAPPEQPEEKQGPKQPQEKPTEQGPAGKEKAEPQAGAQDKQPSEKPLQMPSEQEPAGSEPGQNQPAQKSPQSGQNQPGQEKPQPGQKEQAGQENQELGQNSPAGQETQAPGQKEPAQQKPQSGQNQPGPEKAQPGQQTPKSEQGSDSREGSANQSSSAGQEAPVPKQPSSGGQESSSGKQPPSSGPESASAKPPSSAAEKRPEEGQTTTEQPTGKQQTESPSEPIGPKSPPERIDPVANPGKAFEEILRDRAQQETATKQPSAKPAAQPESKPDTQAESNPGAQPKSQPDLQPESKPGVLPESKPGLLPESKPGLQPESKPGSQPESKPAAQPEKQPGHSPEGKPEGKPALESPSAAGKEKPSPAEAKPTPGQPKSLQPDQPGGEKTGPEKGPPEAQEANQPRSGPPGQKPPSAKPSQEPQSPSISKKQSDSRGDQSGDRSGGGQQGGGQQAPQPGVGTPGSQSPADQGGQTSQQPGPGSEDRPGQHQQAPQPTGSTGPQQGPGQSAQSPGSQPKPSDQSPTKPASGEKPPQLSQPESGTEKPSGQIGVKPPTQLPEGPQPPSQSPDQPSTPASESSSGKPSGHGAGNPETGGQPGPSGGPIMPNQPLRGDDPNLEYTRQAVDMALEHLRDRLREGDLRILEKLRWSREDAETFLRRWEDLKRQAAESPPGSPARKQLEEVLKNLGLRPRGVSRTGQQAKPDDLRRMREGRTVPPPPDWEEQFRAFRRGIRGEEE